MHCILSLSLIPLALLSDSVVIVCSLFDFRVNYSKNAIVKPPGKNPEKEQHQIDKAMKRVREATYQIEDEIDPGEWMVYST